MRKFILLTLMGILLAAPAMAEIPAPEAQTPAVNTPAADEPAYPPEVPATASGAIDTGQKVVQDAGAKKWFGFSAGVIWLLMFVFKWARKSLDFMQAIPKRILYIAVPLLSVIAMLLARFQGELSWAAALGVLSSGPVVAFANDFFKRGILGKEPETTVRESTLKVPGWAK